MSDTGKDNPKILDVLNDQEIVVLRKVQQRIEVELFHTVLGRLKTTLLLMGAAVTIFGFASTATLKSAIVDAASDKLAINTTVREQVIADALTKLEKVNTVVQRSQELESKLTREETRALTIIGSDLEQISRMLQQIAPSSPTGGSQNAPAGKQ